MLTSSPDSTITAPSLPAGEGNGQPITAPSASQPPIPPAPATQTGAKPGPKTGLLRFLPPAEVLRFLIVGACNTLFSYILYAGFGALFTHLFPAVPQFWIADAALICATPIAVTFSFLGFKHFVFKTRGNYLKEWVRCFAVYLPTLPAGLVIVGVATRLFLPLFAQHPDFAKYPAGVVNSAIIASYSYFGHKKFSFKK